MVPPQSPSELQAENSALRLRVQELEGEIAGLNKNYNLLLEAVQGFKSQRFGPSSERTQPGQLALFDGNFSEQGSLEQGPVDPPPTPAASGKSQKGKKGHGRKSFPEHLEREVIMVDPPQSERICSCCGKEAIRIGEEVTEQGSVIPVKVRVKKYVRGKYACPEGCESPIIAELPAEVIPKCKWDAGTHANVVTSKFADHAPLNRQVDIFKRQGINIPTSTIGDIVARSARLLSPIVEKMREEVLSADLLFADETTVRVICDPKGNKRQAKTGYMWVYRTEDKIVFDFTPSRSRAGPIEFLGSWSGTLVTDGYRGYDEAARLNEIIRAACMSHARRKFEEALSNHRYRASIAIRILNRLFWIERAITRRIERLRGQGCMTEDEALQFVRETRARRAAPLMKKLKAYLMDWRQDPGILPKSTMGKAVRYMVGNGKGPDPDIEWKKFIVFLSDPTVPIHNNLSENALRLIALGRKNWQLAGSIRSGDAGAVLYSLTATCRVLEINPLEYLTDALIRIGQGEEPTLLTPWAWKAAQRKAEPAAQ